MRCFVGIEREADWSVIGRHPLVRSCLLRATREAEDLTDGREGDGNSSGADGTGLRFGLSICRGPQQPFPWVSGVAVGGPAEEAGLVAGDCLLCISRTPLFGLPVSKVARALKEAALPRAGCHQPVDLLYWRPPLFEEGSKDCPVASPTYENAQAAEMTAIPKKLKDILATITCPVCCENPITKPVTQCTNGHLLCLRCRRRSARCPICRTPLRTSSGVPLGGRCLLADQILAALAPVDEATPVDPRKAEGHSSDIICRKGERNKGREVIVSKRRGGPKAIVRGFASWLLESRRERRPDPESLNEGDIYRLCAAM